MNPLARFWSFLTDLAADRLTQTIKFGQLTSPAPRTTAASPVEPVPATPSSPPRVGLSANPHLMAYDCLLDHVDDHRCVDEDGEPIRAGGSCRDSLSLRRSPALLKRAYPELLKKAEDLRLPVGRGVS